MYYDQLTKLGIRLRKRSGQEKTTCPQCSEGRRKKTDPCLSVSISQGDYNCHNCGWKGNVRAFVVKENLKKFEGIQNQRWERNECGTASDSASF